MSNAIIVKDLGKVGGLEACNVYIKDVVVFYAKVHEPQKKYQSEEREFGLTAFIDEAAKDKLLDEVLVNKTFAKVGVDKTTKPPRRIKYPLSSQIEEGKVNYDIVDGLFGFSITKAEFSKGGKKMFVNVIDTDGERFTDNVGNGSVCTLKLFGYRNQEGQLVISLDTVQVIKHVPYEGNSSDGTVTDDVLGVKYTPNRAPKDEPEAEQAAPAAAPAKRASRPAAAAAPAPTDTDAFDDDIPF